MGLAKVNLDGLLETLRLDEGWRKYIYDDANGDPIVPGYTVVGHPTIGHGLCVERGRGELPLEIGELWLKHAVEARWKALVARLPWVEDQPVEVQLALGNMAYQLGVEGLCGFKRMLAALEAGDREMAAKHALNSKWAKQVPARAQRVSASILGG